MTDSLHETPKRDEFQTESPIRAFTTWDMKGLYAIGKGFRPALVHLVPYLNAMEEKEGWQLVQILESATQSPSFVFRSVSRRKPAITVQPLGYDLGHYPDERGPWTKFVEEVTSDNPVDVLELLAEQMIDGETVKGVDRESFAAARSYADDPINPSHYKKKPGSTGRECADIGERLSANGYQILKYCWRLGGKDDPCQELGKAIWYAESEVAFMEKIGGEAEFTSYVSDLDNPDLFFHERLNGMPPFTQDIARMLWFGYDARKLRAILEAIREHQFHLDCGRGLAI